jgi:4a-hydroxytetrahydrobiopterin dehydratase
MVAVVATGIYTERTNMQLNKLSAEQLAEHLKKLPGWQVENEALTKQFEFPSFVTAEEFVNSIALSAEAVKHHPDIDIRYNKVVLGLSTHSAGGLTALDAEFAASADSTADTIRP